MSLLKVYISSNLDDAVYEIKSDFNDQELNFIYSPNKDQFKEAHLSTLLTNNNISVLVGVEGIKYDLVASTLNFSSTKRVIWVFKKLAKNTKIYKELKKNIDIHSCLNLSKVKDKNQFLGEIVNRFNIPRKYLKILTDRSGDDKSIICQEMKKMEAAVSSINNPLDSFISDHSDLDALLFVDSLLKKNLQDALKYYSRLRNRTQYHHICYLLGKQILSYIYLCQGDTISASKVWRIPDWLLNQKKNIAKNFGMRNLCNLYNRIIDETTDYETGKDPDLHMRRIIWDVCR